MKKSADPNGAASPSTASLLGGPPLIGGESTGSYEELLGRICSTLRPRDCLEEIWIRDVVDLVWETFRLRRMKATLITDEARSEIAGELNSHHPEAEALAQEWAIGGEEAAQTLCAALGSAGLSLQTLTTRAVTASYNLERIRQIDRMLVSIEARRAAALRELDTHRGTLGQKLRCAISLEEEGAAAAAFHPALAAQGAGEQSSA